MMSLYIPLVKFCVYCTFSSLYISIFQQNIPIDRQYAYWLCITEQGKILVFSYLESFVDFIGYEVSFFYNIIDRFFKVQFLINSNTNFCNRSE